MNCTTTPMETLTDAVRLAFEKAMPSKVAASWGHANGLNIAGWDERSDEEFVTMVLATIISGGGATPQQDGWHAVGPECCFGALTSGDVELLEYSYPIIIHRYSLMTDSGGAGKFRGGSGTAWEVEPLDKDMLCIGFGEGRRIPAMGAAGATSQLIDTKVGRVELKRDGKTDVERKNILETIQPGETITNMNPGGGGYGNPHERPVDKVVSDVKNGLVSIEGARAGLWRRHRRSPRPSTSIMAATRRLARRCAMTAREYRLGIDAGGTFTDFVIADRKSGAIKLFKALSTPANPTEAIENGLQLIAEDLGRSRLRDRRPIAISASTARPSASTPSSPTRAARPASSARRATRIRSRSATATRKTAIRYDPEYPAATMLVPRYLRKGVRERVISDGSIRTAHARGGRARGLRALPEGRRRDGRHLLRLVGAQYRA